MDKPTCKNYSSAIKKHKNKTDRIPTACLKGLDHLLLFKFFSEL